MTQHTSELAPAGADTALTTRIARLLAIIASGCCFASILVGGHAIGWEPAVAENIDAMISVGKDRATPVALGFWLGGFGNYILQLPLLASSVFAALIPAATGSLNIMVRTAGASYFALGATGSLILGLQWHSLISAYPLADAQTAQQLLHDAAFLRDVIEPVFHGPLQNLAGTIWFAGLAMTQWSNQRVCSCLAAIIACSLLLVTATGLSPERNLAAIAMSLWLALVPIWLICLGVSAIPKQLR